MMRLSTSTNLLCERPDGTMCATEKTLEVLRRIGFCIFDMSFYEQNCPGLPFISDQWEAWANNVSETAARLGVQFCQCHLHTYDFLNPMLSDEDRTRQERLVLRSLDCCRIFGATVAVTHPSTDPAGQSIAKNTAYFRRLLDHANSRGMQLAVENMSGQGKFFVQPVEIIDFVDAFGDGRLGVCWDFEHGAIEEFDQPAVIRALGKRLKATHVSDTASKTYEPFMHILPFSGETNWMPIMQALHDSGYDGCFSFEVHNFAKKLPDALLQSGLTFSFEIGRYLLSL